MFDANRPIVPAGETKEKDYDDTAKFRRFGRYSRAPYCAWIKDRTEVSEIKRSAADEITTTPIVNAGMKIPVNAYSCMRISLFNYGASSSVRYYLLAIFERALGDFGMKTIIFRVRYSAEAKTSIITYRQMYERWKALLRAEIKKPKRKIRQAESLTADLGFTVAAIRSLAPTVNTVFRDVEADVEGDQLVKADSVGKAADAIWETIPKQYYAPGEE